MKRVLATALRVLVLGVFASIATADAAEPQAAEAASKVTLTLADGSTLVGQIVKQEEGKVTIKLATLGEVVIPQSIVVAVDGKPTGAGQAPPQQAPEAGGAGQPGPTGPPAFTPKATWARMIKAGGTFTSAAFIQGPVRGSVPGVTGELLKLPGKQYGAQLYGAIARYAASDAFSLEASYTYAKFEPFGAQQDLLTSDFAYNRKLGARSYLMSRTMYRRDKVKKIDYSLAELAGIGFKLADAPKTKFDLIPGFVLSKEKKGAPFDGDVLFGGGAFENLTHYFNAQVMFEQRALYRVIFQHTEVWALNAYAGFKGQVTKHLAMTAGVTYDYDNNLGNSATVVPAGALGPGTPELTFFANEKGQTGVTLGLQLQW